MSYETYLDWRYRQAHETPQVSVIVPAFNESERILPTLGAIAHHMSGRGVPWELIVVDDGSRDGMADMLDGLGLVNLRLLRSPGNQGKGAAVRRGVEAAEGDLILFTDADNSTPIEELEGLIAAVDAGADVAVGSRAANGATEAGKGAVRRFASSGIRLLARTTLRLPVHDSQCGFKLLRADAASDLFSAMTIAGFSFDLELLFLAVRRGYRVAEVPVQWVDAPGSKVNVRRELRRFLADLVRIRMNDLRGAYAPRATA